MQRKWLNLLALCGVGLGCGGVAAGEWRAHATSAANVTVEAYRALPETQTTPGLRHFQEHGPWGSVRQIEAGVNALTVRPEGGQLVPDGNGDVLMFYPIEQDGNYRIELNAANVGLPGVQGGDGGHFRLSRLQPGDRFDLVQLTEFALPVSGRGESVPFSGVYQLQAGDNLVFRFNANLDAYGDQFEVAAKILPTTEAGQILPAAAPELLLPQPLATAAATGAPLRPGLFWLGVDGGWASSPYAEESITAIQKLIPDLLVIGVASYPDRLPEKPAFYNQRGIPTITQTWGAGYEPYFRLVDAFEYDLHGKNHAYEDGTPLSGTAHGAAMPHAGFREAFNRMGTAAIRRGDSGFGFCDMVWAWGPGRGATGYNPQTVAAFRRTLLGQEEPLHVDFAAGKVPNRVAFADYVRFYTGAEITPEMFGLSDWSEYTPLTAEEEARRVKNGEDVSAHWLLFDLLTHYEWLVAAQLLGETAQAEGGFFQCMPNPEDLANGCDWLFLSALTDVAVRSEEYFGTPAFLNGAYIRFPYFRNQTALPRQSGVVLESGGGGNAVPYYTDMVSYMTAYETTLAAEADMLEGDFWVGHQAPLAETLGNEEWRQRYRALLLYGLGFRQAYADGLKKPEAQFISYTSRRIFRTWGHQWFVWNYHLNNERSADKLLFNAGYLFEGRGEEALINDFDTAEVVFYAPAPPTAAGLEALMRRLESGEIRDAFVPAANLTAVVDRELKTRPMLELYPEWSFAPTAKSVQGRLSDEGADTSDVFTVVDLFEPADPANWSVEATLDGQNVLLKRAYGKGTLHVLCFALGEAAANSQIPAENARTGQAILRRWLAQRDIEPQWSSESSAFFARLYQNDATLLVAAMDTDRLRQVDDKWDWRAPGVTAFSLHGLTPDDTLEYLRIPTWERGQVRVDADGNLPLELRESAYELIYLRPAGSSFADLEARQQEVTRAVELNVLPES